MTTPLRYVLGFAFFKDQVILIRKVKPNWMAGKLNGVGGKCESFDADDEVAMRREFLEETGIKTELGQWHEIGAHIRPGQFQHDASAYKLVLFACELTEAQATELKQTTAEEPQFFSIASDLNTMNADGVSGLLMYVGMALNHLQNRSFYTVTLEQV